MHECQAGGSDGAKRASRAPPGVQLVCAPMAKVITYNVVLFACAKGEQWQQSLHFLSELTSAALQSTVITFNAAMTVCASQGQWKQTLSLLSTLLDRGMSGDVITFSMALTACAFGQQRRRAVPLLSELADRAWIAGCEVAKSWLL